MRIIPKKIKVKNTVYKWYTLKDILFSFLFLIPVFVFMAKGDLTTALIFLGVGMFMLIPTSDGILYTLIFGHIKYLLSKKTFYYDEKGGIKDIYKVKEIKEDGLVIYLNGSYGRVIEIKQRGFSLLSEEKQNICIDGLKKALHFVDVTGDIDLVKVERPVNLDDYASSIYSKLSEDNLVRDKVLRDRLEEIDEINNLKKKYLPFFYFIIHQREESEIENETISISKELKKVGIDTEILNRKEVGKVLKYMIRRDFDEREIDTLEGEELIKYIYPKEIVVRSKDVSIDGLKTSFLSITDYPIKVKNGWGAELFNIPSTAITMRISGVEKDEGIRRIDRSLNEMGTEIILSNNQSEKTRIDIHRDSLCRLLEDLQSEDEVLFDVSLTISVIDYENDDSLKKNVRKRIGMLGFKSSTMHGKQLQLLKNTSCSSENLLKELNRGINSSSLAAVFPFVHPLYVDKGGLLLGRGKDDYPFILDIWKRSFNSQNSNGMVIGKSGSGKSFFLKELITYEWSEGVDVVTLDPEDEYSSLTKELGGIVIDVGKNREGRINPFHIYGKLSEDGNFLPSDIAFNSHLKMLESFYRIVLSGVSNEVLEYINNLTVKAYLRKGIDGKEECQDLDENIYPTFTDLYNEATLDEENGGRVKMYLEKFVSGRFKDIWDGPSTLKVDSKVLNFSFQSLFSNKNTVVANAQMLLVFGFIEQKVINQREKNKRGENGHILIICDEAHLFIDPAFPIALDFFYQMNKRIRKYGGSFIPATQNIGDWNSTEELSKKTTTILKNCQYTFIFRLSSPDMKDVLEVYKVGDGFNEEEQRTIISNRTGEMFFVSGENERMNVSIRPSKFVKELILSDGRKKDE